ncbi:NAD-dependent epimerase/dehydratase family protein [Flintibacter muris]|uniref:NAD-dependent epimerase/dehydratase family protein n=1 Tax=Flintibacter muris TaxID=2941327 RepID=UPI00203BC402|nr:NAD(P)-dependent oxidoreductase [Flintibacter muris]
MKRAIVCGGAGFVGSAVVKELLANHTEVTVIVRPGFLEKMEQSRLAGLDVAVLECDIKDIGQIKNRIKAPVFDVWYQFAWDGLLGEPLVDYTTQIMNIKWVMDAIVTAAELNCKKFIGSGSITQFELLVDGTGDLYDKHRIYKTAKMACEYIGCSVASEHKIEFIWPIITNIYGPGEFSPRLINSMIQNLLSGKHQYLSEGKQYYDFIYISDAAKAFRLIGEYGKSGRSYTIASGTVKPLKEFLTELAALVAPKTELVFGEFSFKGVSLRKEMYSIRELQEDTGFTPEVSFADGIRRTMEWIERAMNNEMDP